MNQAGGEVAEPKLRSAVEVMQRSPHPVYVPRMAQVCKECGCICNSCCNENSLDLHHETEELRSKLKKSNNHITQMEHEFVQSKEYAEQEIAKLQDELSKLRDRYDRLFESHKKMQKMNNNLEDKLLTLVNKFEMDKTWLQKDLAGINSKLLDAKVYICDLEEECERYRSDCNLAVQLLQCKPSQFVAHKLNTLPLELQQRVKSHLSHEEITDLEDSGMDTAPEQATKMIRVPMSTFPPTAMVYSVNRPASGPSVPAEVPTGDRLDSVPTTLIARVLAQPKASRSPRKLYICDKCKKDYMFMNKESQTHSTGAIDNSGGGGGGNNGYNAWTSISLDTSSGRPEHPQYPGVHLHSHRSRLNSIETEI